MAHSAGGGGWVGGSAAAKAAQFGAARWLFGSVPYANQQKQTRITTTHTGALAFVRRIDVERANKWMLRRAESSGNTTKGKQANRCASPSRKPVIDFVTQFYTDLVKDPYFGTDKAARPRSRAHKPSPYSSAPLRLTHGAAAQGGAARRRGVAAGRVSAVALARTRSGRRRPGPGTG